MAAILLVATLGCNAKEANPSGERDRLISQIEGLLSEKTADLVSNRIDEFLAPTVEAARPLERQIAAGIHALPVLTNLDLKLNRNSVTVSELPVSGVRVEASYGYAGVPEDNPFSFGLNYDISGGGGGLKVTSVNLVQGARLPAWATIAVRSEQSPHFLGIHGPNVSNGREVLNLAEQARSGLEPRLPTPLDAVSVLWMAGDDDQFEKMRSQAGLSTAAQAEASVRVTRSSIEIQARQMVVNLKKLKEEGIGLETLQHELGHLALASKTRPITPSWVTESAAMYLAGTRPISTWRLARSNERFNTLAFGELSKQTQPGQHDPTGQNVSLEYAYSAAAAWFLVETFGQAKFWEFYESFSKVAPELIYETLPAEVGDLAANPQAAALALQTTTNALSSLFGLTPQDLDTRVKQWMGEQREQ